MEIELKQMKTIKPTKAWAVISVENPYIDALQIYKDKDMTLFKGEQLIPVIIVPDEKNPPKKKK